MPVLASTLVRSPDPLVPSWEQLRVGVWEDQVSHPRPSYELSPLPLGLGRLAPVSRDPTPAALLRSQEEDHDSMAGTVGGEGWRAREKWGGGSHGTKQPLPAC